MLASQEGSVARLTVMSHTASTVDRLLIRPTHGDQAGAGDNERTDPWEGIQNGAGPQMSHARHHQHQACRSTQQNRRTQASQSVNHSRGCPFAGATGEISDGHDVAYPARGSRTRQLSVTGLEAERARTSAAVKGRRYAGFA